MARKSWRPDKREQLQRAKHDGIGWVVEDQGGDQVAPSLLREHVEGSDDLGIVGAVEMGQQRLERREVHVLEIQPGPHRDPAQGFAEQVKVVDFQGGRDADPGDPQPNHHHAKEHEAVAERGRGQN
jgi:hypothetical protein